MLYNIAPGRAAVQKTLLLIAQIVILRKYTVTLWKNKLSNQHIIKPLLLVQLLNEPNKKKLLESLSQEEYQNLLNQHNIALESPDITEELLDIALDFLEQHAQQSNADINPCINAEDENINNQSQHPQASTLWQKIEALSHQMIVDLLQDEHPQIIAFILSNLDQKLAATLLQDMPQTHLEVIMPRILSILPVKDSVHKITEQCIDIKLTKINKKLRTEKKNIT